MSLLDNIFVNLRVLSKIPEHGRISTTGNGQIKLEDTKSLGGWVASGKRTLNGDSREEMIKLLMQLIGGVTEMSDNIINSLSLSNNSAEHTIGVFNENSKKCYQLNKLCTMLKDAKKGILNLHKTTYSDDLNITAKLDEILDRMNQQQQRISKVLEFVNAAHAREMETMVVAPQPIKPSITSAPAPARVTSPDSSEIEDLDVL